VHDARVRRRRGPIDGRPVRRRSRATFNADGSERKQRRERCVRGTTHNHRATSRHLHRVRRDMSCCVSRSWSVFVVDKCIKCERSLRLQLAFYLWAISHIEDLQSHKLLNRRRATSIALSNSGCMVAIRAFRLGR